MTARTCPHPSCGQSIRSDRFACPPHWRGLPGELKRAINQAWTELLEGDGEPDALTDAQDAAVAWWQS